MPIFYKNTRANTLVESAYESYSPLYLSLFWAVGYGAAFAALNSTLVHVLLFHGKDIVAGFNRRNKRENSGSKGEKDDDPYGDYMHMRLMRRYPEHTTIASSYTIPIPCWGCWSAHSPSASPLTFADDGKGASVVAKGWFDSPRFALAIDEEVSARGTDCGPTADLRSLRDAWEADGDIIEGIETNRIVWGQNHEPSENSACQEPVECVICCDKIDPAMDANIEVLRCGHQFHDYCIGEWASRAQTCPCCRAKICKPAPHVIVIYKTRSERRSRGGHVCTVPLIQWAIRDILFSHLSPLSSRLASYLYAFHLSILLQSVSSATSTQEMAEYVRAAYNNEEFTNFSLTFREVEVLHSVYAYTVMKGVIIQQSAFLREALAAASSTTTDKHHNPPLTVDAASSSKSSPSMDLTPFLPEAPWEIVEAALKYCHSFDLKLNEWTTKSLKDLAHVVHRLAIGSLLTECGKVIAQKLSTRTHLNDETWSHWYDFAADFPSDVMQPVRGQLEYYLRNDATIQSVATLPDPAAKIVLVNLIPFGTEEKDRKCPAMDWLETAFNGHITLSDMVRILRSIDFENQASLGDVQLLQEILYGHKSNTAQIFGNQPDMNVVRDIGALLANTTNNLLKRGRDDVAKCRHQFKSSLQKVFALNNSFYESIDHLRSKLNKNAGDLTKEEIELYRTQVDAASLKERQFVKEVLVTISRDVCDEFIPAKLAYTDEEQKETASAPCSAPLVDAKIQTNSTDNDNDHNDKGKGAFPGCGNTNLVATHTSNNPSIGEATDDEEEDLRPVARKRRLPGGENMVMDSGHGNAEKRVKVESLR
ncbi:hypothetical protein SeLEV6574_g05396 [Synchytrium endobioticum]|uniref:RING-type domain-containing protein n=1 Tax=Synchytrium endobioticum TaxID=286115 RepID=A0A507CUM1_9FUNG|nr:hypothetical protein SeLEV6574_g05396 [Synchytrium endobioticum]